MTDQPIPITSARNRKGAATAQDPDPSRNLYQRLSAITAEVGRVEATSKTAANAGGKPAVGIEDVEEALGPMLARHGVVTEWSSAKVLERLSLSGAREGTTYDVWMVHLKVRFINADSPDDRSEWGEWADIGSNPMAASSFARKAAYKALFHLAAAEDEGKAFVRDQASTTPSAKPRPVLIPHNCPECSEGLAIIATRTGARIVGHAAYKKDGCKWYPDQQTRAAWIAEADSDAGSTPEVPTPPDDEPAESGEVTAAELIRRCGHKIRDYASMDEGSCRLLLTEQGWSGDGKSTDWLRSLTDVQALHALLTALDAAIEEHIPF